MAKKQRNYSCVIRMGATHYDLTVITSRNEVINYDFSRMNNKERKAVHLSMVQSFRKGLEQNALVHRGA